MIYMSNNGEKFPNSVSFVVPDVAVFSTLKIEQRLTAVIAGELQFTDETSSFIKAQFINHFNQIAYEHHTFMRWDGSVFYVLFSYPTLFEDDALQCAQLTWQLHQFANGSPIVEHNKFALALETTTVQKIPDAESNILIVAGAGISQASHLLTHIDESGILATDSFHSASQSAFEFIPFVVQTDQEHPVWQLKAPRQEPQATRGFKTLDAGFIGRDESLKRMLAIAKNLENGAGGIIIIEGEPGIGKSRLMREFCTAVPIKNPTIINGKCTPQRTHYPFSLFISLLNNFFNLRPIDSEQANRQIIEKQAENWPVETQSFLPYLYTLLGLPNGNHSDKTLDPNQIRQQIFVAIRRIIKTLSQQNPIILLLDDLHWIDPISAELLLFFATTIATDPIFIICTQRRQGADAPNARLLQLQSLLVGQTETIFLERLSPTDTITLLQNLLDGSEIPKEFEQLITTKSEGNPYFIEEFVRMFIEQGNVKKLENRWQFSQSNQFDKTSIPLSLNTLIQARIAALPSELKPTLQWAAILGLHFASSTIEAILQCDCVDENLDRLSSRLMVHPLQDSDRWQFHHPLLHTAVYDSIPQQKRHKMHQQIANTIQNTADSSSLEVAEQLAFHLTQANEQRNAIPYLIKSGQIAIDRHAGEEALNHFQKASEFTEQINNPKTIWYWEIILGMSTAYRYLGRYAESSAILETGLHLTETNEEFVTHRSTILKELGDNSRKQGEVKASENYYRTALNLISNPEYKSEILKAAQIHAGLGWLYFSQAKFEEAREECRKTLTYAQKTNHLSSLATAENLLGGIAYRLGDWQEAMRHTTRAMILREEMGDSWGVTSILGNLGILALEGGYWAKAISYFQNSLTLREEIGDMEGIVITHNSLAYVYRNQGNFALAEKHQRRCLQIAQQFNMAYNIANASLELAKVLLHKKEFSQAKEFLAKAQKEANLIEAKGLLIEIASTEAQWLFAQSQWNESLNIAKATLEKSQDLNNKVYEVICWRLIAEASLNLQQQGNALAAILKAQELIIESKNSLELGKTAALAYKIHTQLGNINEAQSAFQQAEAIFNKLGAKFFLERLNEPIA